LEHKGSQARNGGGGIGRGQALLADGGLELDQPVVGVPQPRCQLVEDDGLLGVAGTAAVRVFRADKVVGKVGGRGTEGGGVVPLRSAEVGGGGVVPLAAGAAVVNPRRLALGKPVANGVVGGGGRREEWQGGVVTAVAAQAPTAVVPARQRGGGKAPAAAAAPTEGRPRLPRRCWEAPPPRRPLPPPMGGRERWHGRRKERRRRCLGAKTKRRREPRRKRRGRGRGRVLVRVPRRGVRVNVPVRGRRSGQRGGRWGWVGSAEGASVGGLASGRGPARVEGRDLAVRFLLGVQRPQPRRSPGGRCRGGPSLGLCHEGGRRGGRRPQPGENGGTPQLTHRGRPHASKRRCRRDRSGRCPRRSGSSGRERLPPRRHTTWSPDRGFRPPARTGKESKPRGDPREIEDLSSVRPRGLEPNSRARGE